VRSIAPTSFYPLLAGIATPEQTAHLLRWLDDPRKFGGFWRLPSVTRDDPAYNDNVYWRGRVWPPLNLLTYLGLRRAGEDAAAERLAEDSHRLFDQAWRKGQCPENFNAESGRADDQPDTDLFYGWGGLMPLIAALDVTRLSPWNGWEIDLRPGQWRIGPLLMRGRHIEIEARGGWVSLRQDGVERFATDMQGRWSQMVLGERAYFSRCKGGGVLRLRGCKIGDLIEAIYDGQTLPCETAADGNGIEVMVPRGENAVPLAIHWR
jgi:putative isomerase